jgi:hypothetical protein
MECAGTAAQVAYGPDEYVKIMRQIRAVKFVQGRPIVCMNSARATSPMALNRTKMFNGPGRLINRRLICEVFGWPTLICLVVTR